MIVQHHPTVASTLQHDPLSIGKAIAELAEAHDYARDALRDPWQFAVEISRLAGLGLTHSDLRWLLEKGYAVHAREVTQPGDRNRKFALGANTTFAPDSRFILTDAGLFLAGGNRPEPTLIRLTPKPSSMPAARAASGASDRPHWNSNTGVLYFGDRIVKRYPRCPEPGDRACRVRGRRLAESHRRSPSAVARRRSNASLARYDQVAEPRPRSPGSCFQRGRDGRRRALEIGRLKGVAGFFELACDGALRGLRPRLSVPVSLRLTWFYSPRRQLQTTPRPRIQRLLPFALECSPSLTSQFVDRFFRLV